MELEPVVLLHCSGSSAAQWRSLATRLAGRYRVITPDLIGYGASAPWAGRAEFCLAQEAAAIRSVLGALEQPAHLVGHSYGGGVALHIARTRPELLRSLTLIEPSAFHLLRGGDEFDVAALREISEVASYARTMLANGDYMRAFGRFVDYWSGPGSWDATPGDKRAAFAPQLTKVVLDFHALLNEPAEIEHVKDIDLPTLLLQGGCTTRPSRCVVKRLRDALPAAQFRVVQGAGHLLPVTHRDAVNGVIAEFLDSACAGTLEKFSVVPLGAIHAPLNRNRNPHPRLRRVSRQGRRDL
jgi:pimeloyl-ACP methyl ester carboxylesterase